MRVLLLGLVVYVLFPIAPLLAQTVNLQAGGSQPQLLIAPAFPAPFASTQITLDDYSVDTGGAIISWRIDGVVKTELQNKRTINVMTGDVGKSMKVEAIMTLPNGSRMSALATIKPIYLDLIVEPQTRVPSFYKGRPLPSIESTVNVTALVNAGVIPSKDLVYTWRINNSSLLGGAVRGQNQVSFTMPQGGAVIQLEIARPGGDIIASKNIEVLNVTPELRFHEVNTLYGVLPRALSSLSLISNSATVRAEPYHLDIQTYNQPDLVEWYATETLTPRVSGNPYEITFIRPYGTGSESINFHVRNLTQVLQGVQSDLEVQF